MGRGGGLRNSLNFNFGISKSQGGLNFLKMGELKDKLQKGLPGKGPQVKRHTAKSLLQKGLMQKGPCIKSFLKASLGEPSKKNVTNCGKSP